VPKSQSYSRAFAGSGYLTCLVRGREENVDSIYRHLQRHNQVALNT